MCQVLLRVKKSLGQNTDFLLNLGLWHMQICGQRPLDPCSLCSWGLKKALAYTSSHFSVFFNCCGCYTNALLFYLRYTVFAEICHPRYKRTVSSNILSVNNLTGSPIAPRVLIMHMHVTSIYLKFVIFLHWQNIRLKLSPHKKKKNSNKKYNCSTKIYNLSTKIYNFSHKKYNFGLQSEISPHDRLVPPRPHL